MRSRSSRERRGRRAFRVALLLVLALPGAARAEEPEPPPKRELVYSLGYRVWFETTSGTEGLVDQGGYEALHGPVLGLTYRSWGLSLTYLQGGTSTDGVLDFDEPQPVYRVRVDSEREDFDVALSYRVLGFLRPFVGYKFVHTPQRYEYRLETGVTVVDESITYRGPTVGFNFLLRPFKDDKFFASGTFLYGPLRVQAEQRVLFPDGSTGEGVSEKISVHGFSWDLALGCALGHGLTMTAGYRTQRIRADLDYAGEPGRIKGPIFALLYSF